MSNHTHTATPLLEIKDFTLSFNTTHGKVRAVRNLNLSIQAHEVFAIIGESGCGKSTVAKSINRILPKHIANVESGSISLEGKNLLEYTEEEMRQVRGEKISMIFQEPMSSLNPCFTIGQQIAEVLTTHHKISKKEAKARVIEILKKVHIPSAENRINSYPHQLSGGMQQRAMIAMALASPAPALLIADEPTTALDVTIQAQVLALLLELRDVAGLTILLITHDMGLVAQYADRVAVMYCGKKVEEGTVTQIFEKPSHPYTIGLLQSMPHITKSSSTGKPRLNPIPGSVPEIRTLGDGCPFYSRCTKRTEQCKSSFPAAVTISHKKPEPFRHLAFCHNISSHTQDRI